MADISNKEILKEILTELKEIKLVLKGRPIVLYDEYEKSPKPEQNELRLCRDCGDEINPQAGILMTDTDGSEKFYCCPCWKVILTRQMKEEMDKEEGTCWKCKKNIEAGRICYECARIDPNKGISSEAINATMDGLMKTQEEVIKDKKVECVECKKEVGISICSYDPAMNRYICGDCEKQQELNKKLEERKKLDEEITRVSNRNIERK